MKRYIITEQDISLIITELGEAPTKYAFNSVLRLKSLKELEEKNSKESKKNK